MKPSAIFKRIKVPRVPRRDKRLKRLGGYPAEGPQLTVERFEPVLNHQERLVQALGWVSQLGPESVDEATGHPLDNLVNAQSDEWQRKLAQQHQVYQAVAQRRLLEAHGVVEQYRYLQEQDEIKLQAADTAVESAMLALSGQPPQPTADAVSRNAVAEDAARAGQTAAGRPSDPFCLRSLRRPGHETCWTVPRLSHHRD